MTSTITWRFLVVEDMADIADQVKGAIPQFFAPPQRAEVEVVNSFQQALLRLADERFDILILDLKDDVAFTREEHDVSAGMEIFAALKRMRFAPVIFYTAHAHTVKDLETAYVRVVEKSAGLESLREAINEVLATRLPELARQVEEAQRSYMWDFVSKHWQDFDDEHDRGALAYLLARRLAVRLQHSAREFATVIAPETGVSVETNIHPMEMYIHPALEGHYTAGDIIDGTVGDEGGNWIVLTPSCDFEQLGRLDGVLLAHCVPLTSQVEYEDWMQNKSGAEDKLKSLIGDNRQKKQPNRFKFLPGTFFLPDSLIDFQRLVVTTPDELRKMRRIATLDSPYAEAVLTRFSGYFGRLGTADVDKAVVLRRLLKTRGDAPSKGAST